MVTTKNLVLFFFTLVLNSCVSSQKLQNGSTKIPKDFKNIKAKYQKNKFFPLNGLYEINYYKIGKVDFKTDENSKPWNYDDSFRKFVKFYDSGNVNFFYLQQVIDNSFNPDYNGDRGFYYFVDDKNFVIKIYVKTDDWGGKSFQTYYGKIDGDKIFLRTKQNLAGTNNYIIEVLDKSNIRTKKDYDANW